MPLFAALIVPTHAAAAALPSGFSERVVVGGLSSPVAATSAPDGRVFVAEKTGVVKVATPGGVEVRGDGVLVVLLRLGVSGRGYDLHGRFEEVASADQPLVALLDQEGAGRADQSGAVDAFQRVG